MSTNYVSQWNGASTSSALTRQSFCDILDGKIPYVLESQFLPSDTAKKLDDYLTPQLTPYSHATGPTLLKVGVAQFEFQALSEADLQHRTDDAKERYFAEVEKNKDLHDRLAAIVGVNLWQTVVDKLQSIFPGWDLIVANEGHGKEYFSGIFRAINNSTPIHCDWSPYDSRTEDWIINQVTKQAVFNLYLAPFTGGRTEVHDVQWTPDALKFRDKESYGYSPAILEGRTTAVIEPQVGDLCFFNTRNMHQVFPITREETSEAQGSNNKKETRLTLSSFIGLLPEKEGQKPQLILWS